MTDSATGTVAVSWLVPGLQQAASELAGRLGLPLQAPGDATAEMLLQLGEGGLSLRALPFLRPAPLRGFACCVRVCIDCPAVLNLPAVGML